MRTEIVAIGTELLLGQITDTNSSWMGEQLALSGIDSFFQTKVGDNLDRIVDVIELALGRSDAVICCGGLGPTQDDLTREALARVMGTELVRDEDMEETILEMFASRGRRMPANNLRQAMRPGGASFIPEQPGTAPGLVCPVTRTGADGEPVEKVLYAVPGVPWEMKVMVEGTILPDLRRRSGQTAVIHSRTLRTWGETESALAERLGPRIEELDASGNPTLAFLASGMEGMKVRVTAKAPTAAEADAVLDAEEAHLRALLGPIVFGLDDATLASVVLDLLRRRGLTLAVAESLTGGMVGSRLCDVPGASDVFVGGVVSYASRVKFDLLGVDEGPVVSAGAARQMAVGVRTALGADVSLALTGVAGPDPQDGREPGTVCVAVCLGDPDDGGLVDTLEVRLPGGRRQVREFAVITALELLRRHLLGIA
ncbi:MAG: competence/damage-inducible protein A [Actinomycetes bacterium]